MGLSVRSRIIFMLCLAALCILAGIAAMHVGMHPQLLHSMFADTGSDVIIHNH